jgi:hypothetical protein
MTVLPDLDRAIFVNSALQYLKYNYNALRASEQAAVLPQDRCVIPRTPIVVKSRDNSPETEANRTRPSWGSTNL